MQEKQWTRRARIGSFCLTAAVFNLPKVLEGSIKIHAAIDGLSSNEPMNFEYE